MSSAGTTSTVPTKSGGTTTTSTTTTTAVPNPISHLSGSDFHTGIRTTLWLFLAIGAIVALGRFTLHKVGGDNDKGAAPSKGDRSFIRSWVALSLVGGLLLFCAFSFGLDDTTLRSTLIGGVVANAGAAVAYYFASASADKARQDILAASARVTPVPDLKGKTQAEVTEVVAGLPLSVVGLPSPPSDTDVVKTQNPPAATLVPLGSQIELSFGAP